MALKQLAPAMREDTSTWEPIAKAIRRHIAEMVFRPLIEELTDEELVMNDANDDTLRKAIASGRIQYLDGHFEGRFSAEISKALKKLGAKWNFSKRWWMLPDAKLPIDLRIASATSVSRFRDMSQRALDKLAMLQPDAIAKSLTLDRFFDDSIFRMNKQFKANVAKIGVAPELTQTRKDDIARDYSASTKFDVAKFTRKEIGDLRKLVEKNTLQDGLRRESMIKGIKARYGVTDRKAKFLARQETRLLGAAFQKSRYLDAGVPKYRWKCLDMPPSKDPHSVRPCHWELDGKVCDWNSPPLSAEKSSSGKPCHPGMDFNCRCTAIPLINVEKEIR